MEQFTEQEHLMRQDRLGHEQEGISRYRQPSRSHGSTPVDAFGRQTNWRGTASQLLFETADYMPHRSPRDHHWGGLLPGDVNDTNHGDLTRGGLDRRGVRFLDEHEGYPHRYSPPSRSKARSEAHVMPSHLVRDGENVARVWGDPDDHPVGPHRSEGVLSETRFIYGGQEFRDIQPPPPATQYQTWRGATPGSPPLRTTGQAGAWSTGLDGDTSPPRERVEQPQPRNGGG